MFYIWSTLNYIFLLETLLFTKCKIFIYLFCFSSCLEIVNSLRKTRTNIIKFFTFKSSTSTNKNEKNEEIEQVDSTLKKEVFIKYYFFFDKFFWFWVTGPINVTLPWILFSGPEEERPGVEVENYLILDDSWFFLRLLLFYILYQ